jgi:hypothetical protein
MDRNIDRVAKFNISYDHDRIITCKRKALFISIEKGETFDMSRSEGLERKRTGYKSIRKSVTIIDEEPI